MKVIGLTNVDGVTLVDDDDYEYIRSLPLPYPRIQSGYAAITVYVHKLIYEKYHGPVPKGMVVDHIDGDRLNNQKSNLQLVTRNVNSHRRVTDGECGFKGVTRARG